MYDRRMKAKVLVPLLAVFVGLPAMAQFDADSFAANLRARYGHGPLLDKETLFPRPDVEITVDFAANGHVCRIQIPPFVKSGEDLLTELVPLDIRGRELNRLSTAVGAPSVSSIQYENLTISESWQGDRQTGTTVIFPKEACTSRR